MKNCVGTKGPKGGRFKENFRGCLIFEFYCIFMWQFQKLVPISEGLRGVQTTGGEILSPLSALVSPCPYQFNVCHQGIHFYKSKISQNEKKTTIIGVFILFPKYSLFLSVSPNNFIKHKPLIFEDRLSYLCVGNWSWKVTKIWLKTLRLH